MQLAQRATLTAVLTLLAGFGALSNAQEPGRVTIIYDAFGAPSNLERDWGFSALVEYGGRRILFDTGSDAKLFERNVERLGLDLTNVDAAVISHRHGDHTGGLSYLLEVYPTIKIYTPREGAFFEKSSRFLTRLEPDPSLPPDMRYFGGNSVEQPPGARSFVWDADFDTVTETT